MKKQLLTLLLVTASITAFAQKPAKVGTSSYLEEKRGFKNIILGQDIDSISQDISISSDTSAGVMPGVKYFEVTNSELKKVGESVSINKIIIGSFDNKIAFIYMKMKKPNGSILKKSFTEAYGGPYQSNRYIDNYVWSSKNIALSITYDRVIDDVVLMYDRKIYESILSFDKAERKKSVSEL